MHTNPNGVLHFIQCVQNYFTLTENLLLRKHKEHKELKSTVVHDLNDSLQHYMLSKDVGFTVGLAVQ